jgi:hypothetical protein
MATEEKIIPPKNEWRDMSVIQLMDVKHLMNEKYYAMRRIDASFANQYLKFINELDVLISMKSMESDDPY